MDRWMADEEKWKGHKLVQRLMLEGEKCPLRPHTFTCVECCHFHTFLLLPLFAVCFFSLCPPSVSSAFHCLLSPPALCTRMPQIVKVMGHISLYLPYWLVLYDQFNCFLIFPIFLSPDGSQTQTHLPFSLPSVLVM